MLHTLSGASKHPSGGPIPITLRPGTSVHTAPRRGPELFTPTTVHGSMNWIHELAFTATSSHPSSGLPLPNAQSAPAHSPAGLTPLSIHLARPCCHLDKIRGLEPPCPMWTLRRRPPRLLRRSHSSLRTGESATCAGELKEWPGTPWWCSDMRSTAWPVSLQPFGVSPELAGYSCLVPPGEKAFPVVRTERVRLATGPSAPVAGDIGTARFFDALAPLGAGPARARVRHTRHTSMPDCSAQEAQADGEGTGHTRRSRLLALLLGGWHG